MNFRLKQLGLEGYAGVGIGFEDAEIEQAIEGEELVQSVQESSELQTEVGADLATVERLEAQASGLEDIAAINEQMVDQAGESELALTEVAADLATVGTDIEGAEEMVPALESFKGGKISMEGIKDTAKQIWAAIKAFMRKIWEKIVAFWRRITDQVPSVVKAAKKLQARAEATRGKSLKEKADKTTITSSEGAALVIDDNKCAGMSDLVKGLDASKSVCDMFLNSHAKRIVDIGDVMAKHVSDFDLEKPEFSLMRISDAALKGFGRVKGLTDVKGDKRFGKDQEVGRSEHLFGNRAVFATAIPEKDASKFSALQGAQTARSLNVSLMASKEKVKEFTGEFTIATLTPSDCDTLADKIIDVMEVLKGFQSKYRRDLETSGNKITTACEKISSKPDDKTTPNAVKHYQSALQFGSAYAKWCSSPFMSLLSHTLASSRTVISVANKSLSQYKS